MLCLRIKACVEKKAACPGPVDCSSITVVAKDYKGMLLGYKYSGLDELQLFPLARSKNIRLPLSKIFSLPLSRLVSSVVCLFAFSLVFHVCF